MYLNGNGNVLAQCIVIGKAEFKESVGEHHVDLTKIPAMAKESTPDGTQTVNLQLCFFAASAIPAMKIPVGMNIIVAGRESSKELFQNKRYTLERTISVDWWQPRDTDPLHYLEELKVRRQMNTMDDELRILFAKLITEVKGTIIEWVTDWMKNNIETVRGWFRKNDGSGKQLSQGEEKNIR